MTAPTITPERIRDCATIAARRESSRARRAARDVVAAAEARHNAAMAEMRAHKDDVPLTDADWAAVYGLVHGTIPFHEHTGPAAPHQSGAQKQSQAGREERQTNSRLRATYDGERWLAIQVLAQSAGAPTIASLLGISERAVDRWRARTSIGWPTDVDAALMPRTGVGRAQGVTDTREVADLHALAA